MVFAIILGVILGALTVVFALQNVAEVTVTLFSWHFTGSLATLLLATLALGIVISLLMVLPESISGYFRYRKLVKANENLAEELRKQKELTAFAHKTPASPQEIAKLDQGRVTDTLL